MSFKDNVDYDKNNLFSIDDMIEITSNDVYSFLSNMDFGKLRNRLIIIFQTTYHFKMPMYKNNYV